MGNPIKYRNTDNPSQIQGWVSHNKGGFVKRPLSLWYAPSGRTRGEGGGLMKTFHRLFNFTLILVSFEKMVREKR